MRYGALAHDLSQTEAIARAGYDCVELSASAIMAPDRAGFKSAKKTLIDSGLYFDVIYEPLPPDIRICTEGFNTFVWREYLKDVCYRSAELGGRKLVFSNGDSRSIPYEGDLPRTREIVMTFVRMLCDVSNEYELTVVLEPLEETRSNMYNTLDECERLIKILGKPNLTAMCSLRYFLSAGAEDILKHHDIISHVRLDLPIDKPMSFFETLRQIGYSDIVSVAVDMGPGFESEISQAIMQLKKLGY